MMFCSCDGHCREELALLYQSKACVVYVCVEVEFEWCLAVARLSASVRTQEDLIRLWGIPSDIPCTFVITDWTEALTHSYAIGSGTIVKTYFWLS